VARRSSWLLLIAVLALGLLLAWWESAPPAARPAASPAAAFSAMRAAPDIGVIAATPHPMGSAANARVRDHLLARMTSLGLSPQILPSESHRGRLENIVGVLPGRDRSQPALALMAHYDSVPGSPGAGDDAAGVASILEVVRALKTRGPPRRDLVVVFTDGEEGGLLGAKAFFGQAPLASRIGLAINLEARGGAGRAAMFETSSDAGGLIDVFRRTATAPSSNSAAVFLYQQLPNDTDFTVVRKAGIAGYNFAFIGRQFDYHAPTATLANLDLGAVQSMGEQALSLVEALAFADALPGRAPDLVYSQVFGALVAAYPPVVGWAILVGAAGLMAMAAVRAGHRGRLRLDDILLGAAGFVLMLVLAGGALWLAREATGIGHGFYAQKPLLARFELWEGAMAAVCLAAGLSVAALIGRAGDRAAGAWLGMLTIAFAAAVAAQALEPRIAFVLAWPVGAGALAAATTALGRGGGLPVAAVIAVAAAGWLGALAHAVAVALDLAPALALFGALAALSLWPLLAPVWTRGKGGLAVVAAAWIFAGGLVGYIRFTDPWSPRFPQSAATAPNLSLPQPPKPL